MQTEPGQSGVDRAAITRDIVRVLRSLVGRGPTKAKAYVHDDCALVLLREGHTTSEGTIFEAGGARTVAQDRVDLSEVIREPLIETIERHTGRRVVGFMSSSQQNPDLLSFVFVFEASPLLQVVGDGVGDSD